MTRLTQLINQKLPREDVSLNWTDPPVRLWSGHVITRFLLLASKAKLRRSAVGLGADTVNWRLFLPFSCIAASPTTDKSQSGVGLTFSQPITASVDILTVGVHVRLESLEPERPKHSRWRQHVPCSRVSLTYFTEWPLSHGINGVEEVEICSNVSHNLKGMWSWETLVHCIQKILRDFLKY